jgi:hypothetical protein
LSLGGWSWIFQLPFHSPKQLLSCYFAQSFWICALFEREGTFMGDMEGTMVIRAWAESDDNAPFRARLISSQPGTGAETVEVVAGSAAVLQAVQLWLDSLESP